MFPKHLAFLKTLRGKDKDTVTYMSEPKKCEANEAGKPWRSFVEEKVKETVIETLIELDLIPKAQKKKALPLA
jgi:hypothetical protein